MLKSEVRQHLASQKLKYIASNVTFLTLLCNHTWVIDCSSAALNRLPFVSTWKYMKCAWADRAQISAIEGSMDDIGKPPSKSHALLALLSPPGALYLFPLLSPCIWLCVTNQHTSFGSGRIRTPWNRITFTHTQVLLFNKIINCRCLAWRHGPPFLEVHGAITSAGRGSHNPFYCSVLCSLDL